MCPQPAASPNSGPGDLVQGEAAWNPGPKGHRLQAERSLKIWNIGGGVPVYARDNGSTSDAREYRAE